MSGRRLVDHLNMLDPSFLDRISRLLREGVMRTGTAEDFVVHSDEVVIVRANTNASCGYCYVVAYLAQEQPALASIDLVLDEPEDLGCDGGRRRYREQGVRLWWNWS